MSLLQKNKLGILTENREKLLREEIIHTYENVGAEYDDNGVIVEGTGNNWLEGLSGQVKNNVAILFENQAKYLIQEATDSTSAGSFEYVAFPVVRRVYSRLLANDIVSVQAMTTPSATMFFYYPKISDRISGTDTESRETQSHSSPFAKNLATCVGANCPDTTYSDFKSLYDKFYDDALYDHSKGKFTIITATGSTVTIDVSGNTNATAFSSLPVDEQGCVRRVIYSINGLDGTNSGTAAGHTARLNGAIGLEIDMDEFLTSFTVVASTDITDCSGNTIYATGDEVNFHFVAQRYGKGLVDYSDYCNASGELLIEIDLTHPDPNCSNCTPDGYVGAATGNTIDATSFAFAWRKYDSLEFETEMGEVSFELKRVTVSATMRALRARWSPEMAQDVMAYHSIDAEAELTSLMSEQMAMEVDREVLLDLKKGAAWKLRWNYRGWKYTSTQKYTQKEWNQTLITAINQLSAQIHKATLRGGANFIVVSAEASAIFDDLENFMVSNAEPAEDNYNLGIKKLGTLGGRYTVYVDPYSKASHVLVGHKGTSLLDTGYIFAPYVAAMLTPTLNDPNNFTNVKGLRMRYAKKMVNNRYYGLVHIDNVITFDVNLFR
jgi:hypothetical protein